MTDTQAPSDRTVPAGDAELAYDKRFRARVRPDGLVQVAVPPPANGPDADDEAGPCLFRVGGLVFALLAAERERVRAQERAYDLEAEVARLREAVAALEGRLRDGGPP